MRFFLKIGKYFLVLCLLCVCSTVDKQSELVNDENLEVIDEESTTLIQGVTPIEIDEMEIKPFMREGFTVIEWGGSEIKRISTITLLSMIEFWYYKLK